MRIWDISFRDEAGGIGRLAVQDADCWEAARDFVVEHLKYRPRCLLVLERKTPVDLTLRELEPESA